MCVCACAVDDSGRSEITLQRKEIEKHLATAMKCVYFEGYAFVPVIHITVLTLLNVNSLVIYSHRKVNQLPHIFDVGLICWHFFSLYFRRLLLSLATFCIAMCRPNCYAYIRSESIDWKLKMKVSQFRQWTRQFMWPQIFIILQHVHSFFVVFSVFFAMVLWHRQWEWRTDTHTLRRSINFNWILICEP